MNQATKILAATPADLFGPFTADRAGQARVRRTYRRLVQTVHPDLVRQHGLEVGRATAATARLNELWEQWCKGNPGPAAGATSGTAPGATAANPGHGTQAHVVGAHRTYLLKTELWRTPRSALFATDRAGDVVVLGRKPEPAPLGAERFGRAVRLRRALGDYAGEPVDRGVAAGHNWVAYRLPQGMRTLREVRAAYPRGLDGEDWAWMARRILGQVAVLETKGITHGALSLDSVLIQPEEHGVILLDLGEERHGRSELADAAGLFAQLLKPTARRELRFAAAVAKAAATPTDTLTAKQAAHEYDLLLGQLYGPRRFREFWMPAQPGTTKNR